MGNLMRQNPRSIAKRENRKAMRLGMRNCVIDRPKNAAGCAKRIEALTMCVSS
jgi:hypothetical protein